MAFKKSAPAKKSAAKKAAPPKSVTPKVQLPAGFRAITSGEYGEEWEYEKNPLLQGTVVGNVREVEAGSGRNKRINRVVSVKSSDDGHTYTLWESASLKTFFDNLRPGMEVAIAFHGLKDVGKPQPMKMFEGGYTEEDAEALDMPEEPVKKPAAKKAAGKRR